MIFYIQIYTSITKTPLDIFISGVFLLYRVAKPVVLCFGAVWVQLWCNWHGKDGIYALDGQIVVNSIERMDSIFPHGKDVHHLLPIRSQKPVLSAVEGLYPLSYGCVMEKLYFFRW